MACAPTYRSRLGHARGRHRTARTAEGDPGGDDRRSSPPLDVLKAGRSVLGVCLLVAAAACGTGPASQLPQVSQTDSITLASPAFISGSAIPARYTCDGQDVSPPLSWSGGPPAEEFALIATDPDARGGEFVHWIVYAILASANSF